MLGQYAFQERAGLVSNIHPIPAPAPVNKAMFRAAMVWGRAQTIKRIEIAKNTQPRKKRSSKRLPSNWALDLEGGELSEDCKENALFL